MRARNIKPGFFKNEELAECSTWARLMFPGLWMMADREGKLENRPKRIKAEIFPFDNVDVAALVCELEAHGLIKTYSIDGCAYIWIIKFCEHQRPHQNEVASVIPNYISTDEALATKVESACDQGAKHFALNPSPSSLNHESVNTPLPPTGDAEVPKPKRERKPRSASSLPFADDFATFWKTYPRKVARPNAEKAWAKIVKAGELPDMDTLLAAVANQADAKDWRTDQTYCPHPATWLNGKRWEDSVTPARGVDTSWHQYRDWSTRYLIRRRAIHPDDTPEPTQDIVDAGAQWLGEWICPDGFSEPQIKAGIVWLLDKPRRCQHVKHLGDLGLYSQGVGGNLGTWCVNGAMGMQMPADPFNPGPMDGGPPRDIA